MLIYGVHRSIRDGARLEGQYIKLREAINDGDKGGGSVHGDDAREGRERRRQRRRQTRDRIRRAWRRNHRPRAPISRVTCVS